MDWTVGPSPILAQPVWATDIHVWSSLLRDAINKACMVNISSATASTESSTAFGLFDLAIEMGNAPKYETQYRPIRSNMNQVTKKWTRYSGSQAGNAQLPRRDGN